MYGVKLDRVVDNLLKNYIPFTLLSDERRNEAANIVRLMELKSGEIVQLKGGKSKDFLFVIEGSIEVVQGGKIVTIGGPEDTRKRPVVLDREPAYCNVFARSDAIICHADREMIDSLISWDEIVSSMDDEGEEMRSRIEIVRNSLVFRRIPLECVESAFKRMRVLPVKAGETVIKEGDDADAYYIISSGKAEAFRSDIYDGSKHKMADLGAGDAFGCEALVSGFKRSETVTMTEDGSLLVLDKSDFEELISKQMVRTVNAKIAKTMIESGYKVIDVRYVEEYEDHHIEGSQLIPLCELSSRINEIDKDGKYIVCCHGGGRSAVAALKLSQAGIEVVSLEGGLREWEYEMVSS